MKNTSDKKTIFPIEDFEFEGYPEWKYNDGEIEFPGINTINHSYLVVRLSRFPEPLHSGCHSYEQVDFLMDSRLSRLSAIAQLETIIVNCQSKIEDIKLHLKPSDWVVIEYRNRLEKSFNTWREANVKE